MRKTEERCYGKLKSICVVSEHDRGKEVMIREVESRHDRAGFGTLTTWILETIELGSGHDRAGFWTWTASSWVLVMLNWIRDIDKTDSGHD